MYPVCWNSWNGYMWNVLFVTGLKTTVCITMSWWNWMIWNYRNSMTWKRSSARPKPCPRPTRWTSTVKAWIMRNTMKRRSWRRNPRRNLRRKNGNGWKNWKRRPRTGKRPYPYSVVSPSVCPCWFMVRNWVMRVRKSRLIILPHSLIRSHGKSSCQREWPSRNSTASKNIMTRKYSVLPENESVQWPVLRTNWV